MATDPGRNTDADGAAVGDLEAEELYAVVRTAVRDALLDVLGTVALLAFALLFVYAGARLLVAAPAAGGLAVGIGCIVVGVGIAASALGLGPSVRD